MRLLFKQNDKIVINPISFKIAFSLIVDFIKLNHLPVMPVEPKTVMACDP
jgi:hypothetical protein